MMEKITSKDNQKRSEMVRKNQLKKKEIPKKIEKRKKLV